MNGDRANAKSMAKKKTFFRDRIEKRFAKCKNKQTNKKKQNKTKNKNEI